MRERELWEPWLASLEAHGIALQLREGGLSLDDWSASVAWLRARFGGTLLVNLIDPVSAPQRYRRARDEGVDGVHLPAAVADSLSPTRLGELLQDRSMRWIGRACHNVEEVHGAAQAGLHYATLSPIFPTPSKPNEPGLGPEVLSHSKGLDIRVLALGGVDAGRVGQVLALGAWGVAGIRAFENEAACRDMAAALAARPTEGMAAEADSSR